MPKLLMCQVRVLRALMPDDPADPTTEWPLLNRTQLNRRAGFTELSGNITRALRGGMAGARITIRTPGLLETGLVVMLTIDVMDAREDCYRATPAGVEAYRKYVGEYGEPKEVRDPSSCTNKRYKVTPD
jgi:hypothetical protein